MTERAAFLAGAAARRRLRSDSFSRLLHAGPASLRERHSGDLATIVVDKIEALDGLFARYLPAATFAIVGLAGVLVAVLYADPWAALVLLGCGVLVPIGMAFAGIGAAAASRNQFIAMARLQARFLDRARGIATIVLYHRREGRSAGAVAGRVGPADPHHARPGVAFLRRSCSIWRQRWRWFPSSLFTILASCAPRAPPAFYGPLWPSCC